jgi:hypothetical protein
VGAGQPTLIQSVQRALRLLEVVADHGGRARAKEVARAAGLPLATTYHLLRTCAHEGWLQHLDDGSYVLGHRIDVVRDHGTAARGWRMFPTVDRVYVNDRARAELGAPLRLPARARAAARGEAPAQPAGRRRRRQGVPPRADRPLHD